MALSEQEALFRKAHDLNTWIAEPQVMLSQILFDKGEFNEAAHHAAGALQTLYDWGTQWCVPTPGFLSRLHSSQRSNKLGVVITGTSELATLSGSASPAWHTSALAAVHPGWGSCLQCPSPPKGNSRQRK